jgi:3-phenylpropionate/trans-cinnamate dioxygenase ferredoxin subunit
MTEWVAVCAQADLVPGQARLVDIHDLKIGVYNLGGEYFALEDLCTHEQFPLLGCGLSQDLLIVGEEIRCPRHGARFSIRTGDALCPPAYEPTPTFPVRIFDGIVQIQIHRLGAKA